MGLNLFCGIHLWDRCHKMRHPQFNGGALDLFDYVLIRHDMDGQPRGKMRNPTSGPFQVLRVLGSTLEINKIGYTEKINIRRVQPYKSNTQPSRSRAPPDGRRRTQRLNRPMPPLRSSRQVRPLRTSRQMRRHNRAGAYAGRLRKRP